MPGMASPSVTRSGAGSRSVTTAGSIASLVEATSGSLVPAVGALLA